MEGFNNTFSNCVFLKKKRKEKNDKEQGAENLG